MSDASREQRGTGRLRSAVAHPFWQAVAVFAGAYALVVYGLPLIPPLFGVASAPVPRSVVVQYMVTVAVGVLLYVSADEERWRRFREPVETLLADPRKRAWRALALTAAPLLAGFLAYQGLNASVGAPSTLRSVHPAPPSRITFRGESLDLEGLENPLRFEGSLEEHLSVGARVYARNCVPCHGDRLDGNGHFAHAFDPPPADFTSSGTIAQLTEGYVFWRIAKGGPGLPREGTPWNSAMPAWEEVLTADEIWSVILFLYDRTGWSPRTWEQISAQEAAP